MTEHYDPLSAHVRHQVLLERVKMGLAHDFNTIKEDLLRSLENLEAALRGTRLSDLTRSQLRILIAKTQVALEKTFGKKHKDLLKALEELAKVETGFELQTLKASVTPKVKVAPPLASAAWALANTTPMSATGTLLKPWIKDMFAGEIEVVNKAILRGFAEGWTNDQLFDTLRGTRRLNYGDGVLARMGRHVTTIVRTSVQHVSSTSREAVWNANRDILDSVKWISTLDSRTSAVCRSLDGRIFKLGEGPRPPIHPNCRSTTMALLKGKLRILQSGTTRASVDGPVSGDLTYYEWLKTQDQEFIEGVLGPTRAAMFLAPDMTAEKFARYQLSSTFEPLTIEEMKKLYGI